MYDKIVFSINDLRPYEIRKLREFFISQKVNIDYIAFLKPDYLYWSVLYKNTMRITCMLDPRDLNNHIRYYNCDFNKFISKYPEYKKFNTKTLQIEDSIISIF